MGHPPPFSPTNPSSSPGKEKEIDSKTAFMGRLQAITTGPKGNLVNSAVRAVGVAMTGLGKRGNHSGPPPPQPPRSIARTRPLAPRPTPIQSQF